MGVNGFTRQTGWNGMDLLVNRVGLGWNGLIFFGFVWVYPWVTMGWKMDGVIVAAALLPEGKRFVRAAVR